ncbi:hypothetical protein M406DRAFT_66161 [Cryphonectria parasitica EP155]|uniref:CMP/dCMP-type deaminase domain-containing protein n=1 Tax=Cryphonectria parasitica (strain ATCC 38755 / EP155) TaxID=660469 RepID=A0A9P4YA07_CRYP1|nr:uncharacterized protein M406DRAFT_66161 [Cryphonectria parasitica EP155]KAF3769687.1 hypothetical protein M406DRAFT_66161 [Cryphonectria parasitica EP155]
MKADSYLNLCIEQARLSPLHYRHGCVVVKGGKVVGQGFNDYRPGFDGGSALKTGILPKGAFSSADEGTKLKPKKQQQLGNSSTFKPVEALSGNCGSGHHTNAHLSMHSEMMAINSALASSSALAASSLCRIKPQFKLSGGSKRNRASRNQALATYVRAVCLETVRGAEAQQQQQPSRQKFKVKGHHHQNQAHHEEEEVYKEEHSYNKQPRGYHSNQKKEYKSRKKSAKAKLASNNKQAILGRAAKDTVELGASRHKNKFGQRKTQARNEHLLVPHRQAATSSAAVKDRMKHPKLVGADLYVVRLAKQDSCQHSKKFRASRRLKEGPTEVDVSESLSVSSEQSSSSRSLHDELTCKVSGFVEAPRGSNESENNRVVAESRPCYRCVSYMHSAGIKRVFWTTNEGKWKGAKVRDLVDQLDGATAASDSPLGLSVPDVFVTKHEVLLLRRLMMGGESQETAPQD